VHVSIDFKFHKIKHGRARLCPLRKQINNGCETIGNGMSVVEKIKQLTTF